jgi:pyruvate formate lyase activating enzyme
VAACLEKVAGLSQPAAGLGEQGELVIDRSSCDVCGGCAEACTHDALKLVGREMSVSDVLAEIEKDRAFYRRSGGGVTIGGGEPLAQHEFTAELLETAQDAYLHTAIETSGHAAWKHLEKVLRHVDLLHFDLKHMDPERHEALTGRSNELILSNLVRVLTVLEPQAVIIRIPIIPGCNDGAESIRASARFVAEAGFTQIELMPYHRFGVSKYGQYGMVYRLDEVEPAPEGDLQSFRKDVESFGLREVTGCV